MIFQLSVPAAVPDVTEIRILEWHKEPGDSIEPGELVVEFETHKAVIEIRAAQPGVLREIVAPPGEWRNVGVPVGYFSSEAGEAMPADAAAAAPMPVEFAVT